MPQAPVSFFTDKDKNTEAQLNAQRIIELGKIVDEFEKAITEKMKSMIKTIDFLEGKKTELKTLSDKHGNNPPIEVQKTLLQLEADIKEVQGTFDEIKPLERLKELEETLNGHKLELRQREAVADINYFREKATATLAA